MMTCNLKRSWALLVCALWLCLCVASWSAAVEARAAVVGGNKKQKAFAELDLITTEEDEYDSTLSHASSGRERPMEDVSTQRFQEILRKFELDFVPEITDMIDHLVLTVEQMTSDHHFRAANKILAALLDALMETLQPLKAPNRQPVGTITKANMKEILDVMRQHFEQKLASDPEVASTQLKPYVDMYVSKFFDTLLEGYASMVEYGFSLNWTLLLTIMPFLSNLPTDIFYREHIAELLAIPGQLKNTLHTVLEQLFSGDQAHFIRILLNLAKNVEWNRLLNRHDKVEL